MADTLRPSVPGRNGGTLYPIQRGEVRNPNGSRAAGAVVADWYNAMAGYSRTDLEAIVSDPDASNAQVSAAQQWLQAREGKLANLVEVCDRTNGTSVKQTNNLSRVERVKRIITPAPSGN